MTMNQWIGLVVAIIGGFAGGSILSRVVSNLASAPSRPGPIRDAAPALARLVFSVAITVGLVVALGIASPSSLEQFPADLVDFLPRVLAAAIIVIAASILSAFATAALTPALGRLRDLVRVQILRAVHLAIITLAALMAIRQLGIDTMVVNLALAAIFFGAAGAMMLLVAFGGRQVATEVASGRILRRMLHSGDVVRVGDVSGRVVAVHPTAIEVETGPGATVLVPSSRFVAETITVERPARTAIDPGPGDAGTDPNG
ncbi:MAG: mechanosensitive ion channel domain-containing protein [Acidimicrobiales bacterium]